MPVLYGRTSFLDGGTLLSGDCEREVIGFVCCVWYGQRLGMFGSAEATFQGAVTGEEAGTG